MRTDHDYEIVLLDGKGEQVHVLFYEVLNVEFEVQMESFGEWPFQVMLHHLQPSVLPVSHEVVVRFVFCLFLMPQNYF